MEKNEIVGPEGISTRLVSILFKFPEIVGI